jgi:hypothetical protein
MDVVGHQAIRPDRGAGGARGLRQQLAIDAEILLLEERRAAPIAALRDVIGHTGNDEPGKAGHGRLLRSERLPC